MTDILTRSFSQVSKAPFDLAVRFSSAKLCGMPRVKPSQQSARSNGKAPAEDAEATYRRLHSSHGVVLKVSGRDIEVLDEDLFSRRTARGNFFTHSTDVIHDLILDSLLPLTVPESRLQDNAVYFLSAFSPRGTWTTRTPSSSSDLQSYISQDIISTFLRFRFPFIRFRIHLETRLFELRQLQTPTDFDLRLSWSAWAPPSIMSSNPLVACGTVLDRISVKPDGSAVIENRTFSIENMLQAELMRPKPLLRDSSTEHHPIMSQGNSSNPSIVMHLSRSQWFLQFLRSSQSRLNFIVALSALLASIQPLAKDQNAALSLAIIGIVSATVSVVSLIFGWLLRMVETYAAKRQFDTKVNAREGGERMPTFRSGDLETGRFEGTFGDGPYDSRRGDAFEGPYGGEYELSVSSLPRGGDLVYTERDRPR